MILSALAVLSSAHRGEQTYVLFLLVKSCIETLGKLFAVVLQWAAQAKWTSEQLASMIACSIFSLEAALKVMQTVSLYATCD